MGASKSTVTIDNRILFNKLVVIAIPISIQGVVSATLGLVDNLMVGTLGESELAAVGIATQLFFIHYLFLFGFNSGTATFLAQFYGTGDFRNIRKVIGFAITVGLVIGAVFFCLAMFATDQVLHIYSNDEEIIALARPYVKIGAVTCLLLAFASPMEMAFKATQQTRIPMIISIITFSTNTFLNYVFIFGHFGAPALGVAGAAVGTTAARCLEFLVIMIFVTRPRFRIWGPLSDFLGWSRELVTRVVRNSIPTTANEVMWSIGTSLYVAAFSRIGTTDYAAYQAANSIAHIFLFAVFSVGDAALILIGQKLGEGDKEYTYALAMKLLKIGVLLGIPFGIAIMLCAKPLVGLFGLTALGKHHAFLTLIIIGILLPLDVAVGMCITGILRGGGDTRYAAAVEIGGIWLISVPMAFMASLWWHLPIYLAYLCVRTNGFVEIVFLMRRILSKKWMNTVITGL